MGRSSEVEEAQHSVPRFELRHLVPYRFIGIAVLFLSWAIAVPLSHNQVLPTPWAVLRGMLELVRRGLLVKYVVASLFRVTWGYLGGVLVGVPLGLALGWFRRAERAVNPFLQV